MTAPTRGELRRAHTDAYLLRCDADELRAVAAAREDWGAWEKFDFMFEAAGAAAQFFWEQLHPGGER